MDFIHLSCFPISCLLHDSPLNLDLREQSSRGNGTWAVLWIPTGWFLHYCTLNIVYECIWYPLGIRNSLELPFDRATRPFQVGFFNSVACSNHGWWFGTCFFHSVGNVVKPNWRSHIFVQRASLKHVETTSHVASLDCPPNLGDSPVAGVRPVRLHGLRSGSLLPRDRHGGVQPDLWPDRNGWRWKVGVGDGRWTIGEEVIQCESYNLAPPSHKLVYNPI